MFSQGGFGGSQYSSHQEKLAIFDGEALALLCLSRGELMEAQGEKNRAVLEYYKVLFSNDSNAYQARIAAKKIMIIYNDLKDPREKQIKKLYESIQRSKGAKK